MQEYNIKYKDGIFMTQSPYPDAELSGRGWRYDPSKNKWWTRSYKKIPGLNLKNKAEILGIINQLDGQAKASKLTSIIGYSIPTKKKEYLPFQKAGIKYLYENKNTLLADSPGLGKTIQVMGLINKDPSIRRVLVIAPTTIVSHWYREAGDWLVRGFRVEGAFHKNDITLDQDTFVVMSYSLLEKYRDTLLKISWDLLVLDEGHYIKNIKACRTKLIIGYKRDGDWLIEPLRANRKVIITGTPILNRPEELWNLLHFLNPEIWWSFSDFLKRYCNHFFTLNTEALNELKLRLRSTVMLRRSKEDVLPELPKKFRRIISMRINRGAKSISKRGEAALKELNILKSSDNLRELLKNKDPYTSVKLTELAHARKIVGINKLPYLKEHVKLLLADDEIKLVFFAHHKLVLQGIYNKFTDMAVILTGDSTTKERDEAIKKFQTDPKCRLFVGSIQAAGVGITLTEANYIVFGEFDWVPSILLQAEDRCSRIGSKNNLTIDYVACSNTIEGKIMETLVSKLELIEHTMS